MKLTIEVINDCLKVAKIGVKVEARGDRLSLRPTLPPKPESNKTKPYQQYLALQLILQLAGANFYHLHLRSPERIKELHIYLLA
ncbi:hypothetical protein [Nostoc sp.]|uniref:hypothetical protein n=1 Tax=Nostoc sp. TaxID=1180 RepID=UPI002FF4ABD0